MNTIIYASAIPFGSIREAAHAEASVDWLGDHAAQTACTVSYTACELERYLPGNASLCGDDVTLSDVTARSGTALLLVTASGSSLTAELEGVLGRSCLVSANAGDEGYRLFGCTYMGTRFVVLSGNTRVGTMYAAFAYLERCGVYFLEPGEPSVIPVSIPDTFDITGSPSFITRGTFSSYINGNEAFLEWMAHNRMNFTKLKHMTAQYPLLKKLGIRTSEGGHDLYYRFVETSHEYPYRHAVYGGEGKPDDPYPVSPLCRAPSGKNGTLTYGDAHPEWYALVDGKRRLYRDNHAFLTLSRKIGDNLCTGNPDAVRELVRLVTNALIDGIWKNADYLDVWPLDNGTWCDCPLCRAQGNYATRILMLAYELDRSLKRAHAEGRLKRTVRLICPAYHETLPPPDRSLPDDFDYSSILVIFFPIERCFLHDIDDPVCTETNTVLKNLLQSWTKSAHGNYTGELFIGEYYNVSSFAAMPFVLTSRILHDIPYYYSIGARHFHYMHITARDWGIIGVNNWIYARILWDVNADGDTLLDTYLNARYSSLASSMKGLYTELERVTGNCKYYKHYQLADDHRHSLSSALAADGERSHSTLFPLAHMQLDSRADDPQAGPSLRETLEGLEEALTQLRKLAMKTSEDTVRIYLRRDEIRLRYGVDITRFLYLMCRVKLGDTEYLSELRALGERLRNTDEALAGYDFGENMQNELEASWNKRVYDRLMTADKQE